MARPRTVKRDPSLEKAIQAAGSISELARMLGLSAAAIMNWKKIPDDRVMAVFKATGIPPHELRPDLLARQAISPQAWIATHQSELVRKVQKAGRAARKAGPAQKPAAVRKPRPARPPKGGGKGKPRGRLSPEATAPTLV